MASHDLKEPLRVVAGFVDLLERRASDRLEPSEQRFLQSMRGATDRMTALIDDVLAWSRAGSAPLELADVDVASLVRDTRDNLAAAVAETGATIEVGRLPRLRGDARQLRQLFQNLIGNALKFHGDAAPHITVTADSVPEGWRFRVSDNGIGVDPAEADRIFQMFQRLHDRDAYPGTGVGLAICSTVVERHGGRIWVEPTPGGGTTFCFTIAAGGLAAEVPPLPGVRRLNGRRRRDHARPPVRRRRRVPAAGAARARGGPGDPRRRRGLRPGLEACRLVERLVPDVVLLDLAMPELDGLECIPRMRVAAPDACILVLSGFQAARMAGPVMGAGADGYLEKGVTLSVVRERILAGRTAPAISTI